MKICVVYHDDLDGKCSAAIIYYYYLQSEKNIDLIDFIPYNYSEDISDRLYGYDKLYIVDCALDINLMNTLFENDYKENLIWIDHHKTNIMSVNSSIYGYRLVDDGAACLLTWEYFFSKNQIPNVVICVSDRDTWKFKYGDETRGYTEWLELQDNNPSNINLWKKLIDIDDNDNYRYIDEGLIIYNARIKLIKNDIDMLAYESEIDGKKCLKMNYSSIYSVSDAGNIMLDKGYDIAWIWHEMKDGKIYNSLRGSGKYDVSDIAKKYGGGGHKKASGFIS